MAAHGSAHVALVRELVAPCETSLRPAASAAVVLIAANGVCFDGTRHNPPPASSPDSAQVKTQQPRNEVLVISGIFNSKGDSLLRLNPVRRYAWRSGVLPNQETGAYVMTVAFASGEVTSIPFDALVAADSEKEGTRHGFFEVVVPIKDTVGSVLITDASGKKTFARLTGADIPL